jgi:hypothetical protein
MRQTTKTGARIALAGLIAAAWQFGDCAASAQTPPPPAAAAPAAPAAPAANAMTTPAMTGPLVANPNPFAIPPVGPLGPIYINGAISGMGLFQSSPETYLGDHSTNFDITNGLVSAQNTTGPFQFFVQAGVYSFPALGYSYTDAATWTGHTFGPVPVAYGKIVPNDAFSFQFGKLPTLIGAEYGFTFQNMNIERGLLWFQEPIVSRGIQGNYTTGPFAFSLSLNDGFYSSDYNWLSGLATWTVNKTSTLALAAGGPFSHNHVTTFVTAPLQNNSTIVDLIYTYNNAPWVITPYVQYTHVPSGILPGVGEGSTYGGAVLASYQINDNWSISGRAEVIGESGTDLLGFGPGSGAFSFTLTPTWQQGIFFARAEGSVVSLFSSSGTFGSSGTEKTQGRFVLEGGIVF